MIELTVNGMSCGGCVRAVTNAIYTIDPAAVVDIDLAAKRVRVDNGSDAQRIESAIEDAGYQVVRQGV